MDKNGPVVIIEDDEDDQIILTEIFKNLNYENKVMFFTDGDSALDYLNKTQIVPFLILSDAHMNKMTALELRQRVHTNHLLHLKCTPYLFFTTTAPKQYVIEAYSMSIQGFFEKPSSFAKLESTIRKIMEYWKECLVPDEC